MANKQWYEVTLEQNKTIKVYAEDQQEAQEKAENKMGATWCAISAWVAS